MRKNSGHWARLQGALGAAVSGALGPALAAKLKESLLASGMENASAAWISNLVTQLAVTGLGSAFGGTGAATGANVFINNFLGHKRLEELLDAAQKCSATGDAAACEQYARLAEIDILRDLKLIECQGQSSPECNAVRELARTAWSTFKGKAGSFDDYLNDILQQKPAELSLSLLYFKRKYPTVKVSLTDIIGNPTGGGNNPGEDERGPAYGKNRPIKDLTKLPPDVRNNLEPWKSNIGNVLGANEECASLTKALTGASAASLWQKGEHVQDNADIPVGTPVATFNFEWGGRSQYGPADSPGGGRGGVSHTGIYIGRDANGIYLLDQYVKSNGALVSYYPWYGTAKNGSLGEGGSKYYVMKNTPLAKR